MQNQSYPNPRTAVKNLFLFTAGDELTALENAMDEALLQRDRAIAMRENVPADSCVARRLDVRIQQCQRAHDEAMNEYAFLLAQIMKAGV